MPFLFLLLSPLVSVVSINTIYIICVLCVVSQYDEDQLEKDWLLVERKGEMRHATIRSLEIDPQASELELLVRLAGGIGVSVINAIPEELVFLTLEQIEVKRTHFFFTFYKLDIAKKSVFSL